MGRFSDQRHGLSGAPHALLFLPVELVMGDLHRFDRLEWPGLAMAIFSFIPLISFFTL
jgi:hypothetical protein